MKSTYCIHYKKDPARELNMKLQIKTETMVCICNDNWNKKNQITVMHFKKVEIIEYIKNSPESVSYFIFKHDWSSILILT